MKSLLTLIALICCLGVNAQEVIPPAPKRYFNDYANKVTPAVVERLNQKLADFDHKNSTQIVVAIFQTMQSDASMADYTKRVSNAWKVGQAGKNNGVVLFVFVKDRKLRITVGYGLEKFLSNATCQQIIDNEIVPHLKKGDFDGGMEAGVMAIIAAAKEAPFTGAGDSDKKKTD